MNVLVINCGSSSLKYQLIDSISENVLAKGICERIGIDGKLKHKPTGKKEVILETDMPNHKTAVKLVLKELVDEENGVITSLDDIDAIGHRIVHGGEFFSSSTLVTDEVIAAITECNDLAPLHNPANLIGISACKEFMPNTPMVVVFDTAFHQTMPKETYLYGIPYEYYKKFKIRKYGFHGTSHSFVSKRMAEILDKPLEETKIIVCHLGNGASVCAVDGGKSVDTSMGLTPLDGLIMGTRSGSIDPTIVDILSQKLDVPVSQVIDILNKESGMLGVSEISSDFRDIGYAFEDGKEQAILAMEMYCRTVVKYIGSYVFLMNGVDAIVFTAGIGENDDIVRRLVCEKLSYLGVKIDLELNRVLRSKEVRLSTDESATKVYVVPTNEELAIAREAVKVLKK